MSVFSTRSYYSSFRLGITSIHLHHVHCTGDEESLFQCPFNEVRTHDCGRYDVAAVVCYNGNHIHFSGLHKLLLLLFLNLRHRL